MKLDKFYDFHGWDTYYYAKIDQKIIAAQFRDGKFMTCDIWSIDDIYKIKELRPRIMPNREEMLKAKRETIKNIYEASEYYR